MKKLLFVLALGCIPVRAHAYMEVVEVNRATATVEGVRCSTGTAIRLDTQANNLAGFNRSSVRVQNQDSNYGVWIGFSKNVIVGTGSGTQAVGLGEQLPQGGGNAVYQVGKDVAVWCIAAAGAGGDGVWLSFTQHGYR